MGLLHLNGKRPFLCLLFGKISPAIFSSNRLPDEPDFSYELDFFVSDDLSIVRSLIWQKAVK